MPRGVTSTTPSTVCTAVRKLRIRSTRKQVSITYSSTSLRHTFTQQHMRNSHDFLDGHARAEGMQGPTRNVPSQTILDIKANIERQDNGIVEYKEDDNHVPRAFVRVRRQNDKASVILCFEFLLQLAGLVETVQNPIQSEHTTSSTQSVDTMLSSPTYHHVWKTEVVVFVNLANHSIGNDFKRIFAAERRL